MNLSKNPAPLQQKLVTIHVDRFQPFASRAGIDEVVRLQFDYDPSFISRLKALLAVYGAAHHRYKTIGGWLPEHRAWFCECDAWETIRDELLFVGHQIIERKP